MVTVSTYTADEDFTGAALVVSSLGDPDGEQATVLADPHQACAPGGVVSGSRTCTRLLAEEGELMTSSFDRRRIRGPDHRADGGGQRKGIRRPRRRRR